MRFNDSLQEIKDDEQTLGWIFIRLKTTKNKLRRNVQGERYSGRRFRGYLQVVGRINAGSTRFQKRR